LLSSNTSKLEHSTYEVLPSNLKYDGKFKFLLNDILNNSEHLELCLKLEIYLMHFVSEFLKSSQLLIKEIVDDLFRKGREDIKKYNNRNFFSLNDERQNISIKLAWNDTIESKGKIEYSKTSINFLNQGAKIC
jgi:hypothetical protein